MEFDDSQRIFQYDEKELKKIALVIRKMGEEGKTQAREITSNLVDFAVNEIQGAARSHPRPKQATRIADGVKISKSSVLGEFSLGFASQRFSGGATSQLTNGEPGGIGILAGVEFGARKQKQFLPRTARFGRRGNVGTFIWPTLRRIQPQIVKQWEDGFSKIVKKWSE
jgi:hypothetical protein